MTTHSDSGQKISPLEAFLQGTFPCTHCEGLMALEGLVPLSRVNCAYCHDETIVPLHIAGFWLFDYLGGGGMGAVYKAYHCDFPDKFYAVKILPRGKKKHHPRLVRNLQNEAAIADDLRGHACLTQALAWGFEDGEHYMAMDFIEGERMDKKIKRLGSLPENEVLLICLRLLSSMAHIYNRGYLYRDLKPHNVMLSPQEGAYLFDFGICLGVEEALMEPSEDIVAGTPQYFAPERLTAAGENAASELYSLGMVLYHALKGETFYSARELEATVRQEVRPALLQNPAKFEGISPDVADVIKRLIERDPKNRYQTYQEVERDVTRILWLRVRRTGDGRQLLEWRNQL